MWDTANYWVIKLVTGSILEPNRFHVKHTSSNAWFLRAFRPWHGGHQEQGGALQLQGTTRCHIYVISMTPPVAAVSPRHPQHDCELANVMWVVADCSIGWLVNIDPSSPYRWHIPYSFARYHLISTIDQLINHRESQLTRMLPTRDGTIT